MSSSGGSALAASHERELRDLRDEIKKIVTRLDALKNQASVRKPAFDAAARLHDVVCDIDDWMGWK